MEAENSSTSVFLFFSPHHFPPPVFDFFQSTFGKLSARQREREREEKRCRVLLRDSPSFPQPLLTRFLKDMAATCLIAMSMPSTTAIWNQKQKQKFGGGGEKKKKKQAKTRKGKGKRKSMNKRVEKRKERKKRKTWKEGRGMEKLITPRDLTLWRDQGRALVCVVSFYLE